MPQKLEPAGTPKPTGRNHQHAGWCVGCQAVHEWDIKPADRIAADVAWAEAGYKHTPRPQGWFPNARLLKKLNLFPFNKPPAMDLYREFLMKGGTGAAQWPWDSERWWRQTSKPAVLGAPYSLGDLKSGLWGYATTIGGINGWHWDPVLRPTSIPQPASFAPARFAMRVLRARDVVERKNKNSTPFEVPSWVWKDLVARAKVILDVQGSEWRRKVTAVDLPLAKEFLSMRDLLAALSAGSMKSTGTLSQADWGLLVNMAQNIVMDWARGPQTPASETPATMPFYDRDVLDRLQAGWKSNQSYVFGDVVAPYGKVSEVIHIESLVLGTCAESSGLHPQGKYCVNWKPLPVEVKPEPKPVTWANQYQSAPLPEPPKPEPVLGHCDSSRRYGTGAHYESSDSAWPCMNWKPLAQTVPLGTCLNRATPHVRSLGCLGWKPVQGGK